MLRHLPIRWRLAGGSAVLTLVILLGFAVAVGVLGALAGGRVPVGAFARRARPVDHLLVDPGVGKGRPGRLDVHRCRGPVRQLALGGLPDAGDHGVPTH